MGGGATAFRVWAGSWDHESLYSTCHSTLEYNHEISDWCSIAESQKYVLFVYLMVAQLS
jgi:hypothetical protein